MSTDYTDDTDKYQVKGGGPVGRSGSDSDTGGDWKRSSQSRRTPRPTDYQLVVQWADETRATW
jgi:hypothetical protein